MKKYIYLTLLSACFLCATYAQTLPYKNPNLSPKERAADLCSRMTLEEKAVVMLDRSKAIARLDIPEFAWWSEALHGVGRNGYSTVFPSCIGMAASMGAFLLSAGTKGKRLALPNSEIMIHQPLGGAQGQASDIEITAREIQKLKKELYQIISEHSHTDFDKVWADSDRDYWMTAEEAKAYGMIDNILKKK